MMPSSEQLHKHIEHLQALLAAAATSTNYESTAIGNYELRSCLRQIQTILLRDELDFFGDPHHRESHESHHQVVDDLVTLLTLNEFEQQDGMELLDSLAPRTVELITASQLSLTDDHLQRLLPRILHLVNDRYDDTVSTRLDCLLEVLNEHLSPSRLDQVLEEDEDVWIALRILFPALLHRGADSASRGLKSRTSSDQREFVDPGLHVLTGILVEFWKDRINDSGTTLDAWLRHHLISLQHESSFSQQPQTNPTLISRRNYALPGNLDCHVDECLGLVEHYGVDLLEMALQLLEEGAHASQSKHLDREQGMLMALKYSTLATNWIIALGEDFPSTSNLARSLWRALETFIMERLEDDGTNMEQISDEIQMAATDNLWRLTQLHHGRMKEQDVSIVVLTIYRLWRHATYYWTPTTQEWVQTHLLSPKNCKYATLIRRALQVGLLSITHFPEQHTEESSVLSTIVDLVLNEEADSDDPWHSIVCEQMADYSVQMERHLQQP